MYGVGLILGAGIYVLIGDIAGIAGNAMWISFIAAAFIALFTGLSYAELSSMFPKSAAEFIFVKNAFNNNLVAFVTGWMIIFVAVVSAAAVALGFTAYLSVFFPQVDPILSASALIIILSLVNFIGIKESIWMNTVFTFIELSGLALVIIGALMLGPPPGINYFETPQHNSMPDLGMLAVASGLVFFAYYGFENLANISEETKNAPKVIPRALLISIVITAIVYIVVAISAITLVGWKELSSSDAPLAFAIEKVFGKIGTTVLSAIALFATTNTVLMMLISGSRIIFGMARERALPYTFARVHQTRKTPWLAVVFTMIFTVAVILVSKGSIQAIATIAVFGIFAVFGVVNFALIWLRYKQPNVARPFRSPLKIGRFPVLAGLGLVTSIAMLSQFDLNTLIAGNVAAAAGLLGYLIIGRYMRKEEEEKGGIKDSGRGSSK